MQWVYGVYASLPYARNTGAVREGLSYPPLCIDCGLCLRVCPLNAITASTINFDELGKFKYKVAVPSSVLFSQFPLSYLPPRIGAALLELGFDEVWDFSVEIELVNRAIKRCLEGWKGNFPVISSSCPVIVRLVQVAYPTMVDQLLPIEAPRELAARELKVRFSEELGISPEEVAAIYITPCQAKSLSILKPAERVKSDLDGAVGISDIYNGVLFHMRSKDELVAKKPKRIFGSDRLIRWGTPEGQAENLSQHHYLALTGLQNIISVFNDIEKGKIRNIDFLECYACQEGCVGGNLTVDNPYMARSKVLYTLAKMDPASPEFVEEVERRIPVTDFSLKGILKPRDTRGSQTLLERLKRKKIAEEVLERLPGINCGLCGAPRCNILAEDVAGNNASPDDCVFISPERLEQLKKVYLEKSGEIEDESSDIADSDLPAKLDEATP